jgi:hypothetical protein
LVRLGIVFSPDTTHLYARRSPTMAVGWTAHAVQVNGTAAFTEYTVEAERIAAAVTAVGLSTATDRRAAGRAVPPGERGNRARQLAAVASR